jgi:hypothetical protein
MHYPEWIDETVQLARCALELSSEGNDLAGDIRKKEFAM